MTGSMFTRLQCVAVPVTDQDRSKALFEAMGFTITMDAELQPGFRWLELAAPAGGISLALVRADDDMPAGMDTGIRLVTPDARAAHADLAAMGLSVGDLLDWDTAPLMFSFCDVDGNRFYATEE